MASSDPIKQTTNDLESLRHTLLSGTTAIHQSLKKIEIRLGYMSEALKIFEKSLENNVEINHDSLD